MKFNKNEFGWKEKVNTDELVTKNDIPHYNETLKFEISGADYSSFMNNNYFNTSVLNIDETKSYVGKSKVDINDDEEYTFEFAYNKENDVLINEDNQLHIYNHKSYNGTNLIEDVNSAVITNNNNITPMTTSEYDGYFRLYEIDKVELDTNCLPDNVSIPNSLTVGTRIGDIGCFSVSEGDGNTASGEGSHAEGESSNSINYVISNFSPSTSNDDILTAWNENSFSLAKGEASHVEGKDCLALGDFSHAEGNLTTVSGECSHAEGCYTEASGCYSHAEGEETTASGNCSHAEGSYTTASGTTSHAEGGRTTASGQYQHVQGKYNIEDTENKYAHIVGNGEADTKRSNAHTLDWNGNAWYSGKLSQDGVPTEDKDLTTKKYVDDIISNILSFNESGELVVTINGVTKTFVPKQ